MQNNTTTPADPAAPEWARRLLKVREVAVIVGENPATVYRKVDAGIYPPLIHIGNSSRMPGWSLWERIKRLIAEHIEPVGDA